ncbi:MAG: GNAT family N-acetyltransferase [Gammaproteobacteria bacterium]|nr:MAG: GNAT family N-acetyltransferase [Gammaproteobacteria bacterium]
MHITQASINNLEILGELFDSYRQFYQQASDIDAGRAFLRERIENQESVIFLATDDKGEGLGVTQLYPTFSSVSLQKRWILNDLFVAEKARKLGVANALMQAAEDCAKASGAGGLSLSTAIDNHQAQAVYEKRGWHRVTAFYNYNKSLV